MLLQQSQYIFVHEALLEAIRCGNTEIPASELRQTMNEMEKVDNAGEDDYQKQFAVSKWCHIKLTCVISCLSAG